MFEMMHSTKQTWCRNYQILWRHMLHKLNFQSWLHTCKQICAHHLHLHMQRLHAWEDRHGAVGQFHLRATGGRKCRWLTGMWGRAPTVVTIGMKSTQVLGAGAAWQNQAARRNRLRRLTDPLCRSSVKIEDITMASSNYIDNDETKICMDYKLITCEKSSCH